MNSRTVPLSNGQHVITKPNSPSTGLIDGLSDIYTQNKTYAIGDNEVLQGIQGGIPAGSSSGIQGGVMKKKWKVQQLGGRKRTLYIRGNNMRQVATEAYRQLGGKESLFKVENYVFFGRKRMAKNGRSINYITQF